MNLPTQPTRSCRKMSITDPQSIRRTLKKCLRSTPRPIQALPIFRKIFTTVQPSTQQPTFRTILFRPANQEARLSRMTHLDVPRSTVSILLAHQTLLDQIPLVLTPLAVVQALAVIFDHFNSKLRKIKTHQLPRYMYR